VRFKKRKAVPPTIFLFLEVEQAGRGKTPKKKKLIRME
jgi:hypothetical protein